MASTFVNDLRLEEMATGENSGTWGTKTNANLELIGEALGIGTEAITTNADTHTSTIADGSTDPVRAMFVQYTGTLDSACTITIAPNTISRVHIIENATSGSQNIIIKQGSGATVTIPNGMTSIVYLDGAGSGAAVIDALTDLNIAGTFNAASDIVSAGTVQATGDTSAGDGAAMGFTSAEGLILTGQGSTNDVTIKNDADADVIGIPTGTTNVTVAGALTAGGILKTEDATDATSTTDGSLQTDGGLSVAKDAVLGNDLKLKSDSAVLSFGADSDVTLTHAADTSLTCNLMMAATTFEPSGDTAAGDNAAIGFTAAEGLILTGQGSSTDVTIKNDADGTVASIATGTTVFTMNDDVTVVGRAVGSTITAENDATYDLAVGNNFTTTTSGDVTLTFSNVAAGQSGCIKFVNDSNRSVSADTAVAINASVLTSLSTTGTYFLTYYVTAASGANTILVGATAILT